MKLFSTNPLQKVLRELSEGILEAFTWPQFRWLVPEMLPQFVRFDDTLQNGSGSSDNTKPRLSAASRNPIGLLLPCDAVLFKTRTLPSLSLRDLHDALAMEAENLNPFGKDNGIWGYQWERQSDDTIKAWIALTSYRAIDLTLTEFKERTQHNQESIEIWAEFDGRKIPLPTAALQARYRLQAQQRNLRLGMLGGALVTLAVLLALPILFLRAQVLDAYSSLAQVEARAHPAVEARTLLLERDRIAEELGSVHSQSADPLLLLHTLTSLLPDTAHLNRLEIQGKRVRIGGLAKDAAKIMDTLTARPDFVDVRAPSAISRIPGSQDLEIFFFDFVFEPQRAEQTTISSTVLPSRAWS